MNLQHGHSCVQVGVDAKRLLVIFRIVDESAVVFDIDTGCGERRIIWRIECVESGGVDLGASVASVKVGVEADSHLRHYCVAFIVSGGGNFHCGYQILFSIGARLAYRKLAPGENYRLAEIVEHETQCRCTVRHGVGAVKNHKSVV